MIEALQAFHFLRPWWLLALLPAALLAHACLRGSSAIGGWTRVIDPVLLAALLLPQTGRRSALPFGLLLAGWGLAVIGLAGPTWERLPEAVHRRGDAVVVALDLSASMLAADLSPSRLARARFKVNDLLAIRRDAYTGLLVYAGDAHVVTPLSDDTGTVAAMLPTLDPSIMPVPGNDPVAAVRLALELLRGAGVPDGRVLLLTDSLDAAQARAIAALLEASGTTLAVLGVGTLDGAPVPLPGGGFARDEAGGIAIPRLAVEDMREAARIAGANFREISVDDSDIRALLPEALAQRADARASGTRIYDQWRDRTPWVALCLLPLAALGMRRGWLLLLPLGLCLPAPRVEALEWQDLWLRKDQQGAQALAEGDAARAASVFRDPSWQGSARYQAGDWAGAAQSFARAQGKDADYNRGNALARAGKLEEALAAYDAALAADPGMEDARANRKLVEDLLQQQKSRGGKGSPDTGSSADGNRDKPGSGGPGAAQQQPGDPRSSGSSPDATGEQPPENDSGASGKDDDDNSKAAAPGETPDRRADESPAPGPDTSPQSRGFDPAAKPDASAAGSGEEKGDRDDGKSAAGELDATAREEDQAVEQWLRQVPDDPGALLRRKFEYEAARRAGGNGQ